MSSPLTYEAGMQHLIDHYGDHTIFALNQNDLFKKAVRATGVNKANQLIRRYNVNRTDIKVVSVSPQIVEIQQIYGIGDAVNVLYTIEREVFDNTNDKRPVTFYVNDKEGKLSELNEMIANLLEIKDWKFPTEFGETPHSQFLTEHSPYSYEHEIVVDTLRLSGKLKIKVVMNFMNIMEAITTLSNHHFLQTSQRLPDPFDLRLGCKTDDGLSTRYRTSVERI